jgi:hypothetical protein
MHPPYLEQISWSLNISSTASDSRINCFQPSNQFGLSSKSSSSSILSCIELQEPHGDKHWARDENGNWSNILTVDQLVELFNYYVSLQEKGQEFFRKGCIALLTVIQNHKVDLNQSRIDRLISLFSISLALDLEEGANPLFLSDLRSKLLCIVAN